MIILIDLDNVMIDFIRGIAKVLDKSYDEIIQSWPLGIYDMEVALNLPKGELFHILEKIGESYWVDLPLYPYALDFYAYCYKLAPTYFLSAPTDDPRCLSGKVHWLQNIFGKDFNNYILTVHKELCATDKHILIDDNSTNVMKFRKNGGHAILWPTPFNERYKEANNCVDIAKKELDEIMKQDFNKLLNRHYDFAIS